MKHYTIVFVLLFSLLSVPCMAQYVHYSDEQWTNLQKFQKGKKITVSVSLAGEIQGKFVRVEDDNLFMDHKTDRIRIKRENIKRIVEDGKRNWNAPLVGATIGFAAGAIIGNYFVSAYSEGYDTFGDHFQATLIFGGLSAGCGFMTGSLIDSPPDSNVIYEPD